MLFFILSKSSLIIKDGEINPIPVEEDYQLTTFEDLRTWLKENPNLQREGRAPSRICATSPRVVYNHGYATKLWSCLDFNQGKEKIEFLKENDLPLEENFLFKTL